MSSTKHYHKTDRYGTGKAAFIKKRKEIEENKRNQKSKALRDYAKLCRREGIESNRVNLIPSSSTEKVGKEKKESVVATKAYNPFNAVAESAKTKMKDKQDTLKLKEDTQHQIQLKKKERDSKKQKYLKRTRKGQPIMKTHIFSILEKLSTKL